MDNSNNRNYLKVGDYNVICDICGQKRKRSECRYGGKGYPVAAYLLCQDCWDPIHPWTLPVPIPEEMRPVPDSRPRPNDVFVSVSTNSSLVCGRTGLGIIGTINSDQDIAQPLVNFNPPELWGMTYRK